MSPRSLVLLLACSLTTGCATRPAPQPPPTVAVVAEKKTTENGYFAGEHVTGHASIVINLTSQTASFFKGDTLVGVSPVSSGKTGHSTPTGQFEVTEKDVDHSSSRYGKFVSADGTVLHSDVDTYKDARPAGARYVGAQMPYFMRFSGGVGMHAGRLPGYPASHGCVRMPRRMARAFFENVTVGTPVRVEY